MATTGNIPEKDFQNGEFITGPVLKQLILAGTLWSERHFLEFMNPEFMHPDVPLFIRILREACYEMSKCSSDSAGDIFKATEKGANQSMWRLVHPGITFFYWFHGLATALSDNQEISAQDFARAMHKAADSEDRRSGDFGTVPRKIADAAMRVATTTPNIYELFDRALEEARLDFADKQQEGENLVAYPLLRVGFLRMLFQAQFGKPKSLTLSKGYATKENLGIDLILFFKGMQCYIKGNISISDIEEKIKEIRLSKQRELESNKVKEGNLDQWIYYAIALLDATVLSETDNAEILVTTLKVRELIHANYNVISTKQALDELDKLINNLETIYAPKSSQLALRIRNKIRYPS